MALQVTGTILTDPGRQRSVNEDWCGSFSAEKHPGGQSAWAVADGVSGFSTGRDAAKLAVETVLAELRRSNAENAQAGLSDAFARANRDLLDLSRGAGGAESQRYATTLVVALIVEGRAWVANVGDSRAYLLRRGTVHQITRDHTWVVDQVERGLLRASEAASHPKRNVLTRCLGQRSTVQVDIFERKLEPDDRIVLCSDGLTRHVADREILASAGTGDPAHAARRLLDLANKRGGADNVTVGVLDFQVATAVHHRGGAPLPRTEAAGGSRIAALHAIAARISASLELHETLRSVMDTLVELTGAERGFVMLLDESSQRLQFQIGRNLDAGSVSRDPQISRNIVGKVFRERSPLLIGDAMADPEFQAFQSVVMQALRSVMCAPLLVKGNAIGVVYVDNSLGAELFTHDDLDLLVAFASLAAPALENSRLHLRLGEHVRELATMKTTQERILRSVSSAIISVDRDGTIGSFNRAAEEILETSADRAVGGKLRSILPERFMLALGPPLGGEGFDPSATIHGLEMEGELPGRGWVHLRHRLSPMRDESGGTVGYVLVLEDLTERERLDRERRQAQAEREQIQRIFGSYMAPAIFKEIMQRGLEGAGVRGDRRDLTILFADIRGFTGLSERLAPEEVVGVLNNYLTGATDTVLDHEGTIDKFIGDAIMAIFGAPVEIQNHPLQAVRAALAMQRQFAETPASDGQRVSYGIGINSGTGVVGSIGAPKLMSYTVIGDVVNVAARLQSEARGGEVLLSGDTYQQVSNDVNVEELGTIYVKGRLAPVNVYKVLGLRP